MGIPAPFACKSGLTNLSANRALLSAAPCDSRDADNCSWSRNLCEVSRPRQKLSFPIKRSWRLWRFISSMSKGARGVVKGGSSGTVVVGDMAGEWGLRSNSWKLSSLENGGGEVASSRAPTLALPKFSILFLRNS